jgi:hypothetical protein
MPYHRHRPIKSQYSPAYSTLSNYPVFLSRYPSLRLPKKKKLKKKKYIKIKKNKQRGGSGRKPNGIAADNSALTLTYSRVPRQCRNSGAFQRRTSLQPGESGYLPVLERQRERLFSPKALSDKISSIPSGAAIPGRLCTFSKLHASHDLPSWTSRGFYKHPCALRE